MIKFLYLLFRFIELLIRLSVIRLVSLLIVKIVWYLCI